MRIRGSAFWHLEGGRHSSAVFCHPPFPPPCIPGSRVLASVCASLWHHCEFLGVEHTSFSFLNDVGGAQNNSHPLPRAPSSASWLALQVADGTSEHAVVPLVCIQPALGSAQCVRCSPSWNGLQSVASFRPDLGRRIGRAGKVEEGLT